MMLESIAPFANHVWQSTAFALVVWTATVAFRRHTAQLRCALWLTASIKFLIPFSLLVWAGSLVEWKSLSAAAPPTITPAIRQMSEPFAVQTVKLTMPQALPVAAIVGAVWLAGFFIATGRWWNGWRRTRDAIRTAVPLRSIHGMRVMSSNELVEPGVFGVFRSVLVLPARIEECLNPEQFAAVMAHELCHVRRRDNLTGAIHMAVETLFWFHPLVWWIGRRLVEERERACDEEVLRQGNRPEAYAEGILRICRTYLELPLACASGISGGRLTRRIDAILSNPTVRRLTAARKLLLMIIGAAAVSTPVFLGMLDAAESYTFEVASVKPADPNARGIVAQYTPGGGVRIVNGSVIQILTMAYEVERFQVSGGPGWIQSAYFNVEARPPEEDASPAERRRRAGLRLQSLLAERFKLEIHREKKEGAVFALVVARNGPKLLASSEGFDGLSGMPGQLSGERAGIPALAAYLAGQLRRPVLDQTGLTGTYKFKLDWYPEMTKADSEKATAVGLPIADPSRPSLFAALQEQLGLRLDTQKGFVETIVIDRAEKPSAN